MTDRHVTQPRLCTACLHTLRQRIASTPGDRSQLIPCRHADGGVVVALVEVEHGVIVSWDISGPMSESKAQLLAATYLRALSDAGVSDMHAGTVQ